VEGEYNIMMEQQHHHHQQQQQQVQQVQQVHRVEVRPTPPQFEGKTKLILDRELSAHCCSTQSLKLCCCQ
jgi:hypothetical protein